MLVTMNFYASEGYLSALAEVFFRGQRTRVVDVQVGESVLRLLEVDGKRLMTNALFLDYHEALSSEEITAPARSHAFVDPVSQGVIELSRWDPSAFPGFALAPFIDWSMFPTWDDYRAFIVARQRGIVKDRERRRRRLAEEIGDLVFRVDDAQDDVIELARKWKSEQLRSTGQRDYFADPATIECLQVLRGKGLLTASTLRGAGRLLSVWIGFIYNGVWSGWVFTYDPELARYSVGHQLLAEMLEESHRRKHREFDFSVGAESYKLPYATHGRLLGPLGRTPVLRQIYTRVKHEAGTRTPELLARARVIKRAIQARSTRGAP
jgi:CelD/BcsL family acetyltransferase involved in cellulose biosynthesis